MFQEHCRQTRLWLVHSLRTEQWKQKLEGKIKIRAASRTCSRTPEGSQTWQCRYVFDEQNRRPTGNKPTLSYFKDINVLKAPFFIHFHIRFSSEGGQGEAVIGRIEMHHGFQLSQIVLLAQHQEVRQSWRCSHFIWSVDDLWVAFPWV